MSGRNDRDEAEARRIIDRVGAETEARMAERHDPGGAPGEADWAELWGRRIARVLSLVLLAVLLWWLYDLIVQPG